MSGQENIRITITPTRIDVRLVKENTELDFIKNLSSIFAVLAIGLGVICIEVPIEQKNLSSLWLAVGGLATLSVALRVIFHRLKKVEQGK